MTTIRSWSGGASTWASTRPSRLARAGAFTLLVLLTLVGVLVLLPVIVIGGLIALFGFVYVLVRRALVGARAPNGALDGRRNVRVIDPSERIAESED